MRNKYTPQQLLLFSIPEGLMDVMQQMIDCMKEVQKGEREETKDVLRGRLYYKQLRSWSSSGASWWTLWRGSASDEKQRMKKDHSSEVSFLPSIFYIYISIYISFYILFLQY